MQACFRGQLRRVLFAVSLVAVAVPATTQADHSVTRPAHPVRPQRPERPTRIPRPSSATATVASDPTPTATSSSPHSACPAAPEKVVDTRLWHLFWKYPGVTKDLTGRAAFRIPRDSNGIKPDEESASLALVSSTGAAIAAMPELHFTRTGDGSWAASTDQGYVVVQTMPGAYTVSFNFQNVDTLTLPADFYSTGGKLCFSIGDEGVFERFVCQEKPGGGFLCHE